MYVNPVFEKFLPKLDECVTEETGRKYTFAGKAFPSVTTVLSATADKQFLVEWRDRIGDEEADRICKSATISGEFMHDMIESWLVQKQLPVYSGDKKDYFIIDKFQRAKRLFEKVKGELTNITRLMAMEVPLYSEQLNMAGRVDCIGIWKGKPAIIDFKTASMMRDESQITDYFLQCTAYSEMWNTFVPKVPINKIVVLMSADCGMTKAFEKKPNEFTDALYERIKEYESKQPIEEIGA